MEIGPYDILGELGRGGMGAVYRARRADLPRDVALKVLCTTDRRLVARFQREAQAAGRLAAHPGIVGVVDVGVVANPDGPGTAWYLAMDLVTGPTLAALIDEGELDARAVAAIVEQAARALDAAHLAGVLHRDVKPANILVETHADGTRQARVSDFGLTVPLAAGPEVQRLTHSDEVVGTPAFMPPEQALNEGADARTDVWALGATLHNALTGRPPFQGATLLATLNAVLEADPAPLPPTVPAPLSAIVDRCLQKDPDRRYPTAAALADDLARFQRGERVAAHRAGALRRAVTRLGVGVAVVAGLALLGTAWWAWRAAAPPPAPAPPPAGAATDQHQQIGAAWYRLTTDGGADLRRLEDHWHGVPLPAAAVDAALARTETLTTQLAAAYPAARAPAAWRGLARALRGDVDAGAAEIAEAATRADHDPFPHALAARLALARFVRGLQLPSITFGPTGVGFTPYQERPAQMALRHDAATALATARTRGAALPVAESALLHGYADAAGRFSAGAYDEAAGRLTALAGDPLIGPEAATLGGFALFLQGHYRDAAAAWATPAQRGWTLAVEGRAMALLSAAVSASIAGHDDAQAYRDTVAAYDTALRHRPDRVELLIGRAAAHSSGGLVVARGGDDPRPEFRAAIDDLDRALALAPGRADAHANRATAWQSFALAESGRAGDPVTAYGHALDDYAAAIERGVPEGRARFDRAQVFVALAELGDAPETRLREAIEELDRALELAPEVDTLWRERGEVWWRRARRWRLQHAGGEAVAALARSTADLEQAVALGPAESANHHALGVTWYERARGVEGLDRAAAREAFDHAGRCFETAVALNPRAAHTWLNLGNCRLQAAIVDRHGPGDPAARYAAARDAFAHALALQPDDLAAHYGLGYAALQLAEGDVAAGGDPGDACAAADTHCTRVLERRPDDVLARAVRGRARHLAGRYAEALDDYARVPEGAPMAGQVRGWTAAAHDHRR